LGEEVKEVEKLKKKREEKKESRQEVEKRLSSKRENIEFMTTTMEKPVCALHTCVFYLISSPTTTTAIELRYYDFISLHL
jgi:hypothetical protein